MLFDAHIVIINQIFSLKRIDLVHPSIIYIDHIFVNAPILSSPQHDLSLRFFDLNMDQQHRACTAAYQAEGHDYGQCKFFNELTHSIGSNRPTVCAICMSAIGLTDRTLSHSDNNCLNAAHEACLARWLNENPSCPICRGDIARTDHPLPPRLPAIDNEPRMIYSHTERAANVDRMLADLESFRTDIAGVEIGINRQVQMLEREKLRLISERERLWSTMFRAATAGEIPFIVNSTVGLHLKRLSEMIKNVNTEIEHLNRAGVHLLHCTVNFDKARAHLRQYLVDQQDF